MYSSKKGFVNKPVAYMNTAPKSLTNVAIHMSPNVNHGHMCLTVDVKLKYLCYELIILRNKIK